MATKKRGRPATGVNPAVGVRLPPPLLRQLDRWRSERGLVNRPEAIRRLIEEGLRLASPRTVEINEAEAQPSTLTVRYIIDAVITLSPAQCRAARALLSWSQADLVRYARITKKTIADFERGTTRPREKTIVQILAAFETAGIEFTNTHSPGVRIRQNRNSGI